MRECFYVDYTFANPENVQVMLAKSESLIQAKINLPALPPAPPPPAPAGAHVRPAVYNKNSAAIRPTIEKFRNEFNETISFISDEVFRTI